MITDFETWLLDVGYERIFRIYKKRIPGDWTPLEIEQKRTGQSHFENEYPIYAKIVEVIEMPDGDFLIGYREIFHISDLEMKGFDKSPIRYVYLTQIELNFYPEDMDEDNWA